MIKSLYKALLAVSYMIDVFRRYRYLSVLDEVVRFLFYACL